MFGLEKCCLWKVIYHCVFSAHSPRNWLRLPKPCSRWAKAFVLICVNFVFFSKFLPFICVIVLIIIFRCTAPRYKTVGTCPICANVLVVYAIWRFAPLQLQPNRLFSISRFLFAFFAHFFRLYFEINIFCRLCAVLFCDLLVLIRQVGNSQCLIHFNCKTIRFVNVRAGIISTEFFSLKTGTVEHQDYIAVAQELCSY